MKFIAKYKRLLFLWLLVGCAGTQRSCAASCAVNFGADWLIVQYRFDGKPIACWKLDSASVTNEDSSDGIYWKQDGHLIHISGWYNRVQVSGGDYEGAAKLLGVDLARCTNGAYEASE